MTQPPDWALVRPEDGEYFDLGPIPTVMKVLSAWTGGAFHIVEQPIAPGMLVPPHRHTHEDQIAYVVSGTIGFRVGDEEFEAPAGSFAYRRRGIIHSNWNETSEPAVMLEISSPANPEQYFRTVGIPKGGPAPDLGGATVQDIAAGYGITFHPEVVAEIQKRRDVRLF